MRKISTLPGFDPQTAQSVASRYNDYAIPAHRGGRNEKKKKKKKETQLKILAVNTQ
jgi:hypothetical protein